MAATVTRMANNRKSVSVLLQMKIPALGSIK